MASEAVKIKIVHSGKIHTAVLSSDGTEAVYFDENFAVYLKSPHLFEVMTPEDPYAEAKALRYQNLESTLNLLQPKKVHISLEI